MKKMFSFLAGCLLASAALNACVDDNPSVVFYGLVYGESCNKTSSDNTYAISLYCKPTDEMWDSLALQAHVMNHISSDTAWASSGSSSSSGSSFENKPSNQGMIFITSIVIKCKSVDGDSSGCDGKEKMVENVNIPVSGSGGACTSVHFDKSIIKSYGGSEKLELEAYANYKDSGNIKGTTNSTVFSVLLKDPCTSNPFAEDTEQKEDNNQPAQDQNEGKPGIEDEHSTPENPDSQTPDPGTDPDQQQPSNPEPQP